MTAAETLTAKERAWHQTLPESIGGIPMRKLLRLYDAALARAQAAECLVAPDVRKHWDSVYGRMNVAESRLADATELLREWHEHGPGGCGIYARQLQDALSDPTAAPAPAAPLSVKECVECGVTTPFDAVNSAKPKPAVNKYCAHRETLSDGHCPDCEQNVSLTRKFASTVSALSELRAAQGSEQAAK